MDTDETTEKPALPTGKSTVSFSELHCWTECSFRHKLAYVKKIGVEDPSPYTVFGSAVHAVCEHYLKTRVLDSEIAVRYLDAGWSDELEAHRLQLLADNDGDTKKSFPPKEDWQQLARDMMPDLPPFMEETFPEWEYVAAEQQLHEPIPGHDDVRFKGFIDGILTALDKKGRRRHWIIDFKTASWGWHKDKKADFNVQMQLRLYKVFWSQKMGVPMKDIRTGFVLIKRTAKTGARCELVPVSVGDETAKRSLEVIHNMVASVKRGIAIKNRNSCRFCVYKDTEHCP